MKKLSKPQVNLEELSSYGRRKGETILRRIKRKEEAIQRLETDKFYLEKDLASLMKEDRLKIIKVSIDHVPRRYKKNGKSRKTLISKVINFLKLQKQEISVADIALGTNVPASTVSALLTFYKKRIPQIRNISRGFWTYK